MLYVYGRNDTDWLNILVLSDIDSQERGRAFDSKETIIVGCDHLFYLRYMYNLYSSATCARPHGGCSVFK